MKILKLTKVFLKKGIFKDNFGKIYITDDLMNFQNYYK